MQYQASEQRSSFDWITAIGKVMFCAGAIAPLSMWALSSIATTGDGGRLPSMAPMQILLSGAKESPIYDWAHGSGEASARPTYAELGEPDQSAGANGDVGCQECGELASYAPANNQKQQTDVATLLVWHREARDNTGHAVEPMPSTHTR